jgi:hypothetical protein
MQGAIFDSELRFRNAPNAMDQAYLANFADRLVLHMPDAWPARRVSIHRQSRYDQSNFELERNRLLRYDDYKMKFR